MRGARRLRAPAAGFVSQPEPRTIGRFARGKQLCAGNFLFAGHLVEAPGASIWDLGVPSPSFDDELHGFVWLDDLAAVGDAQARDRAQDWTEDWIARYGRGRGPGWTPDLTGRRLIRWINHAIFLLNGAGQRRCRTPISARWGSRRCFCRAAGTRRAGRAAVRGADRADLCRAVAERDGGACRPRDRGAGAGMPRPDRRRGRHSDPQPRGTAGGVHPADLGGAGAVTRRGSVRPAIISPRSNGSRRRCARCAIPMAGWRGFMAAGAGWRGGWTRRWPRPAVRTGGRPGLAMGFARLSAGRTSLIVDAAPPPIGAASVNAHASTLAFELTSGRRPLIVNCGSGAAVWGGVARRRGARRRRIRRWRSRAIRRRGLVAGSRAAGAKLLVDARRDVRVQQNLGSCRARAGRRA